MRGMYLFTLSKIKGWNGIWVKEKKGTAQSLIHTVLEEYLWDT